MIETELCAYGLEACEIAARNGLTRVELCASPSEGGVTPSAAAISLARRVFGLQLIVMIRPRGGDFLYSDVEFEQMRHDVRFARESGADGVALGLLLPDGRVDRQRTAALVAEAGPMSVTFHRAFDMSRNLSEALETIITCGCRRVLTSGGRNTAEQGIEHLGLLTKQAAGRIEIMAGSGVNPSNVRLLASTGVDALHFSARTLCNSVMTYRNPSISMGSTPDMPEYACTAVDEALVSRILKELRQ